MIYIYIYIYINKCRRCLWERGKLPYFFRTPWGCGFFVAPWHDQVRHGREAGFRYRSWLGTFPRFFLKEIIWRCKQFFPRKFEWNFPTISQQFPLMFQSFSWQFFNLHWNDRFNWIRIHLRGLIRNPTDFPGGMRFQRWRFRGVMRVPFLVSQGGCEIEELLVNIRNTHVYICRFFTQTMCTVDVLDSSIRTVLVIYIYLHNMQMILFWPLWLVIWNSSRRGAFS